MMRIAFDIDGVLADMNGALERIADDVCGPRKLLGPPSQQPQLTGDPFLDIHMLPEMPGPPGQDLGAAWQEDQTSDVRPTARQQRAVWKRALATENFWDTLAETEPGIVRRVAAAAIELGWETLFVTNRPPSAGLPVQAQTQCWLQRHGFPLPSVVSLAGPRGKLADALELDVLVDDRLDNCIDVAVDSRAKAVLVSRHASAPMATTPPAKLNIAVVGSVAECLALLTRSNGSGTRAGIVDRIRRVWRLSGSASTAATF